MSLFPSFLPSTVAVGCVSRRNASCRIARSGHGSYAHSFAGTNGGGSIVCVCRTPLCRSTIYGVAREVLCPTLFLLEDLREHVLVYEVMC